MQNSESLFWLQPDSNSKLPIVHFVHGNSFPTGTYRVFLNHLKANYQLRALELHGHNPAFPVTDGWTELCNELIASIEKNKDGPVILVGHSLGGLLSLMAAKRRPDLVRCVVMLDSPVVAGWRAFLLKGVKKMGLEIYFPPAKFSKKRRKSWTDQKSAFQHFASKEIFNIWPQQVLRDYIQFGTEPYPKGVTLHYKREIETKIYCTLPHTISQFCTHPFPVPIGFIWGTNSEECRQAGLTHTKKLVGKHFMAIEGGHLYPLEVPQQTAEYVHLMVQQLLEV